MKKHICRIVCLIGLVLVSYAEAKIISTNKIEDIEVELARADNETLVIFDCNGVIWESAARAFQADAKKVMKSIIRKHLKTMPLKKEEKIQHIMLEKIPKQLLHKKMPTLILVLQSRGVKTLMLTGNRVGKIGNVSLEKCNIRHLSKMGIDFGKSWNLERIVFSCFPNYYNGEVSYATFSDGILFCISWDKGSVLRAFLSKIPSYKFKKIIFIDDKRRHLESVRQVADEIGSEFVGIEYTLAKSKKRSPINLTKIKEQCKFLIEKERWISSISAPHERVFSK